MGQWNDDFGNWQNLDTSQQEPRYQRIAELIGTPESVLDVGCGQGELRNYLHPAAFYVGLEPSEKAANGNRAITQTTAENFLNFRRWDRIVFNEVLYYTHDPIALLRKYSGFLVPDGKILISIYQRPGTVSLAKQVLGFLCPRRPLSNVHCTSMVAEFLVKQHWAVEADEMIDNRWRIFVTYPSSGC